jgi:hypothetical protein
MDGEKFHHLENKCQLLKVILNRGSSWLIYMSVNMKSEET